MPRQEAAGRFFTDPGTCLLAAYGGEAWTRQPATLAVTARALRERTILIGVPDWVANAVVGPCWHVTTMATRNGIVKNATCRGAAGGDRTLADAVLGGWAGGYAGALADQAAAGGLVVHSRGGFIVAVGREASRFIAHTAIGPRRPTIRSTPTSRSRGSCATTGRSGSARPASSIRSNHAPRSTPGWSSWWATPARRRSYSAPIPSRGGAGGSFDEPRVARRRYQERPETGRRSDRGKPASARSGGPGGRPRPFWEGLPVTRGATEPGGRARTVLLASLAAGMTQEQAARAAKISRATLNRRIANDPSFRAELAELRAAMLDSCMGVLSANAAVAAARIVELARSSNEPVALAACRSVIESVMKMRHEIELTERIEALERALGGQEPPSFAVLPLRGCE